MSLPNHMNINYRGTILEKYSRTKRKLKFIDKMKPMEIQAVAFSTSLSVQFELGHLKHKKC